jgi:hypothetical protein
MQTRTPERTVPRYREGDPEPEGAPAPTQARADYLKAKVHGADADDIDPLLPPQNKDVPYVGGAAEVGGTLNCTMGNWTGMGGEPAAYSYSWQSDGVATAATGPDYVVAAGDAGHTIVCIVTATNANGSTAAPPSNAVTIP